MDIETQSKPNRQIPLRQKLSKWYLVDQQMQSFSLVLLKLFNDTKLQFVFTDRVAQCQTLWTFNSNRD